MTCIIAYDIENDKVRTKLAKYLEGIGIRLQKSVFAVEIERHSFRKILRQMEKIAGKDRKIAVFRLCIGCKKNAIQLGEVEKDFYIF